jgi:tetratricopeptide (TPR) repeat protein
LEDAVEIAEELGDKPSLYLASFRLALAYSLNCRYEEGGDSFKKAFGVVQAANNLLGMSAAKSYLSIFCYQLWGRLKLAEENALEALRISEESGDIYTKAMAYTAYGWTLTEKGMLEEARKNLTIGLEFSEKINYDIFNAIARYKLGQVFYEIESWEKSKDHYSKAATYVEHCGGFRSWSEHLRLGAIMAERKIKTSKQTFQDLTRYKGMAGIQVWNGWKSRYVGAILMNIGNRHISEAEEWIKKSIVADEKNGMRMHLGEDYHLFAELLQQKGDKLQARETLVKAINIFKECGADARALQTEKMLSHI